MSYNEIVWLASYPKSGNTWARCFLDAYYLGEVDINELVCSVTDDGAARALPGDGSDPSKYPIDIQMLCRPMALLRLVRQFQGNRIETGMHLPLYVKTHNWHGLPNGMEQLPKSLTKATIYIVRDPRDVAVSFSKHIGKDMDKTIEFMSDRYRTLQDKRFPRLADFIASWPLNVSSYANADTHNVRVWRYEDIKADPVKCFSQMLIHAGERPDMEQVKTAVELVDLANLKKQEATKGFRESSPHAKNQFFGRGLTGGWEGAMTHSQLIRIEKACAGMMRRFKYPFATKAAA